MLYRFASAINASYGLAIAWAYIGAFMLALGMMFVFPPGTLLVFFVGLASLGLTVALGKVVDGLTRMLARQSLARGRCPRCGDALGRAGAPDARARLACVCSLCGSTFSPDGGEMNAAERSHIVDQPADATPNDAAQDASLAGEWRDS